MFTKQALVGTVVLAAPVVMLYLLYPLLLQTWIGQIGAALFVGFNVYYTNKQQARNQIAGLRYAPTGMHKEKFELLIRDCGVDPETVQIRYAYAPDQVAFAVYSCVVINPVIWQGLLDDPQAYEVQTIFDKYIEPTLTSLQKQRMSALKQTLTPPAGNFIFRHELAHIIQRQSARKLIGIGACAAIAAYIAIVVGMALVKVNGLLALAVALPVGMVADYITTILRNYFWQQREEKYADAFSVQQSTKEEIQEVAAFFRYHQDIYDSYQEPTFIKIASEYASGHPHGSKRYMYLMAAAAKKS